MIHVLDPHVNSFRNDPPPHPLVNDHTERVRRDVEDAPRLPVVRFVGHALLYGAVTLYVHDVAHFVRFHVRGQRDNAVAAEFAREKVAGPPAVALRVRHDSRLEELLG